MTEDRLKIPLITLVGDPLENFYQLGLRDKNAHGKLLQHLQSLARTPWKKMDLILTEILKQGLGRLLPQSKLLAAYSEGLGRDPSEVAFWLLIPEFMSSMPKWFPGMAAHLWGCSSFFAWDKELNHPLHGRVLDFPLLGSYDLGERAVLYQLDGEPKIFSLSSAGLPYPSITSMTDQGVTLAIHQKFTKKLNPKGTPIFEICHRLLREAHDKQSALQFLKRSKSLTTWGLNLSFKTGEVLSIDISGDELDIHEFQLEEKEVLYFNNRPWAKEPEIKHVPHGFDQYCAMRERAAEQKILELKSLERIDEMALTRSIATPIEQKDSSAREWNMDVATPASLTIVTMDTVNGSCTYVPGPAPKYLKQETLHFSKIWDKPAQAPGKKSRTTATSDDYSEGMRHYMQAQVALDEKDRHGAFHHLQMSVSRLEKRPEALIARFFLAVLRFMHEKGRSPREHMLEEFHKLKGKLPPYLNDQALLFISRLEHILGLEQSEPVNMIGNLYLRNLRKIELKIHPRLLHKVVAPLMAPRLEILDILYGHLK